VAIINDALVGVQRAGAKYKIEPDRQAAIALAISSAMAADIVLLRAKAMRRRRFLAMEREYLTMWAVARDLLRASGYECGPSPLWPEDA